jgi:predicted metal-dependent hydrolase
MADIKTKIVRSRRKSMSLHVNPDNTLTVKVPWFLPSWEIDKFLNKYSGWIERKISQNQSAKKSPRKYSDGEEFLFMGETLKLKIGDYKEIKVHEKNLFLPSHMVFRAKKEIESFYIKEAKKVIMEMLDKYSKDFKTNYHGVVHFSDTSSKWGSCTHDNRLQFNWRLIMAPFLVIRYVVVHELAHTLEKNHSRFFWTRVASVNPSYKQQIKWLKDNGSQLILN